MSFTLVATAKNEGPYLLEWVAHHRAIGFDDILIFQNDSDDLTHEILTEMDALGLVDYRYNQAKPGRHQVRAYKRAARNEAFQNADFAMALDLDEFLYIRTGQGQLNDLLDALPETDVVLLNWRRFGDGGQTKLTRELVTERFLYSEPDARIETRLTPFKALFRPKFGRPGIHRPPGADFDDADLRYCNGSGMPRGSFDVRRFRNTDPQRRALAQINHYVIRDAASFMVKSDRGSAHQTHRNMAHAYWRKHNFNDTIDAGLAAAAPRTIAAMEDLDRISNGKLGTLRRKSIRLHKERFDKLMQQSEFKALYDDCRAEQIARVQLQESQTQSA